MRDDTERDLAAWDAEIEEEFRRVMAATKAAGRKKRGQRWVGLPFAFLADVYRSTDARAPLIVAMLIYRRTCVCKSRTVTLPGAELTEIGIGRETKRRALAQLEAAGLIQVERTSGHTAQVTLLWKPG